jgi:hypothetical protein
MTNESHPLAGSLARIVANGDTPFAFSDQEIWVIDLSGGIVTARFPDGRVLAFPFSLILALEIISDLAPAASRAI